MAYTIGKAIQAIVETERDEWITDHGDVAEVMRAEIAILETIVGNAKASIAALETMALQDGYAVMETDPNYKPKALAPTKEMYIELHGEEAFFKVVRWSKAKPHFKWIA